MKILNFAPVRGPKGLKNYPKLAQTYISETVVGILSNFSAKLGISTGQKWHVCYFQKNPRSGTKGQFGTILAQIVQFDILGST